MKGSKASRLPHARMLYEYFFRKIHHITYVLASGLSVSGGIELFMDYFLLQVIYVVRYFPACWHRVLVYGYYVELGCHNVEPSSGYETSRFNSSVGVVGSWGPFRSWASMGSLFST